MKNKPKTCEGCYWYDKCAQEFACEDYSPLSDDEIEEQKIDEYERDLTERHSIYKEQIEEQNS